MSDNWSSRYLDAIDRKMDAESALNEFLRSQDRVLALPGDQDTLARFLRLRSEVRLWSESAEALLLGDELRFDAAQTYRAAGKRPGN
ncbi:MAG TPA: hypothetical protein QGF05_03815 [Dehalococcoidia bacterium]|nr:hypothetical protein [Dehalococcoidia bacterium]